MPLWECRHCRTQISETRLAIHEKLLWGLVATNTAYIDAHGLMRPVEKMFQLARAVRVVDAGEALLAPSVTRHLIDEFRRGYRAPIQPDPDIVSLLTLRERDVLALVAAGLSNDEIASRLFISPATVKTHIGRTLAKVGLRTRAQLVVLAYQTGLASAGGTELARGG